MKQRSDEIRERIQNCRDARKIAMDLPITSKEWQRLPEKIAQFFFDKDVVGRRAETPPGVEPLRKRNFHMVYLPVGTDTDQRIILNWIAVAEDCHNERIQSRMLEVLHMLEEHRVTIPPFDRMPHRPFPRHEIPYALDVDSIPSIDEAREKLRKIQMERLHMLANFFYESKTFLEEHNAQEGDAFAL